MTKPALAVIGHNNPPAEPTPFDQSSKEIDDLFAEAKNWLDGEEVASQGEADAVAKLMDMLRKASKFADDRRVEENKPFDEGKAAVQAKYAELIADTKSKKGRAVLAIEACKAALTPWLIKLDNEKQAAAAAARKDAEEKALAAQEVFRNSQVSDLTARADAEALLADAKKAEAVASRAENDKAQAKGGARAVGLRTTYQAEITDAISFARHCWTAHRPELDALLAGLAQKHASKGGVPSPLPGVTFHEIKTAT